MEPYAVEKSLDRAHERGYLKLVVITCEKIVNDELKTVPDAKEYTVLHRGSILTRSATRLGDIDLYPGTKIVLEYTTHPVVFDVFDPMFSEFDPRHFRQTAFKAISDMRWEKLPKVKSR